MYIGIIWLYAIDLGRKSLDIVKKTLEAAVIPEVIIPLTPPKEIKAPQEESPPPFVPSPDVPVSRPKVI